MRKAVTIGVVVFLLVLVARAPAGILRTALDSTGRATLLDVSGTLWNGAGELLIERQPWGSVSWDLQPVTLLQGRLRYHVGLSGADHQLEGDVDLMPGGSRLNLSGDVGAGAVNPWLRPYDITLSGTFTLSNATLTLDGRVPSGADGEITWTGGPVTYRLSGTTSTGNLPEMTALLGPGPEAVVFPTGGQTPLLQMSLEENGFAKVGVTKLLTKLLNSPWPGADPDHAVVLEVEEQVF